MKRRYFIGSTGILAIGLFKLGFYSPSEQLPKSLQSLMTKFKKELETSLSDLNIPEHNTKLTSVERILKQRSITGHSYFYYLSRSKDRVLLLNKDNKDLILINPENPQRYFALA